MLFPQFASTAYSNLGVSLLGRTLEKATGGVSWEEWVRLEIMKPLRMDRSGPCVQSAVEAAAIVDGVDEHGRLVPRRVHNGSHCPWGAPAGDVFSTPADMARWTAFLSGALAAPAVLDPASVLELRNTAALQPDGISAVSGGTLEAAFSHGRWMFNKLGCLDGYRSAISLVPSLGLALFAAAASTCDFFGDGDAVGFPIISQLIPALEGVLAARFAEKTLAPPGARDYVGLYCAGRASNYTVALEAGGLVIPSTTDYPWVLLPLETDDSFRLLMREPNPSIPGCSSPQWPGAQLCHTSCFREMSRGDGQLLSFSRNASGHITSLTLPGAGVVCDKAS